MQLKSIFVFTLLFAAFGSMAQTIEERSELSPTCVTVPTTLSVDAEKGFEFKVDMTCQIWNYGISIVNDAGEAVFQTKDLDAVWDASLMPAGTYSYTIVGTIGNTVEYEHVAKEGIITVVK